MRRRRRRNSLNHQRGRRLRPVRAPRRLPIHTQGGALGFKLEANRTLVTEQQFLDRLHEFVGRIALIHVGCGEGDADDYPAPINQQVGVQPVIMRVLGGTVTGVGFGVQDLGFPVLGPVGTPRWGTHR